MGADIHLYLIDKRDNAIVMKTSDLYEGRNSEWFDNMQQNSYASDNIAYDYLPTEWHYKDADKLSENCFYRDATSYGHRAIELTDLLEWYEKYKPYEDGVYLTEREKWLYETKGIIKENSIRHYPDEDAKYFTVVETSDPIVGVIDKIAKNNPRGADSDDNFILLYCFDC